MPSWNEVLREIKVGSLDDPSILDNIRKKYLQKLQEHTGRNVIAYYSGWLQKPNSRLTSVNDEDMEAFMSNVHKMDRQIGLDLILHTPGGDLAATESIVYYLHKIFGNNIRAFVPQISMSAGTMIAMSCNPIVMGKQSSLGPIDPQMGGLACQAVIEEFETAKEEVKKDMSCAPLWQTIINKYHPTFLLSCKHAIAWSQELAEKWLERNMFSENPEGIEEVMKVFGDHSTSYSHARHIPSDKCKAVGLNILDLEDDNDLQDLILTVHHTYMHTFGNSNAVKIVENHLGAAIVKVINPGAQS